MRNINLFVNWFDHPERGPEFDYCLKRNLAIFDRVINLKGRPTFNQFLDVAKRFNKDVNVIANLDIYFDETIRLSGWIAENEIYCLTRWEDDGIGNVISFADKHYGHPGDWSQDAWIFTGIPDINLDFCMGEPGCDNHIAYLFTEAGYKVTNPSMTIKAIHIHNIDRDASRSRSRVGDGKYLNVPITKL